MRNKEDLSQRSRDVHWPDGFSPEHAELFTHNEVSIHAPPAQVWRLLVAAEKWPEWYPNSRNVRILGKRGDLLREDSRFEWETFGVKIESTVAEFVPEHRIGWFGDSTDLHGYHTWMLIEVESGCHVISEEAAQGPGALGRYQSDPDGLHKAHDLWCIRLKRLAETGSPLGRSDQLRRRRPTREVGPTIRNEP